MTKNGPEKTRGSKGPRVDQSGPEWTRMKRKIVNVAQCDQTRPEVAQKIARVSLRNPEYIKLAKIQPEWIRVAQGRPEWTERAPIKPEVTKRVLKWPRVAKSGPE